jgi:hypothetical protein
MKKLIYIPSGGHSRVSPYKSHAPREAMHAAMYAARINVSDICVF